MDFKKREVAPPSEITDAFAKIERFAEGCDLGDACLRLRLVKRAFFAAYHSQSASKSTETLASYRVF